MAEADIQALIDTPDGDASWGSDMRGAMTTLKTRYGPGLLDVAVADGGTGASDAATARENLGAVGSSDITTIKRVTQAEYDALANPDATTLYVILG